MVKLQKIDPSEIQDLPEQPIATPAPIAKIEVQLARSQGIAIFRKPTALDLVQAEKAIGGLTSNDFPIDLYRELAAFCCEAWGSKAEAPEPHMMRLVDDQKVVEAFLTEFTKAGEGSSEVETYSSLLMGKAQTPGLDAIEIDLSDGTKIILDEPTQLDARKRDNSTYAVEAALIMASSLCRSWNGETLSLAEYRVKMNRFSIEDYLRVTRALNFFRL